MDVILDVDRMAVDETGVGGFVWPIAREEILAVGDAFLPPLVAAARRSSDGNDESAELLSIVLAVFLSETIGLYQAYALCRRLRNLRHTMIPPAKSRLLPALAAGSAPPPPPLFEGLRRGLPQSRRRGLASLYRASTNLQWNGLSLRLLGHFDRDQDVAAIQRLPLIRQHARAVAEFVRFVHPSEWFHSLDGHSRDDAPAASNADTIEGALTAARIGFAAGNEEAPDYLIEYLRDWLVRVMALTGDHLSAILRQPARVPHLLWTGSGSGIWSRILRHATRRLGGTVTGHDHGNGEGYLESGVPTLAEFESCDTFVTFTPTRARALAKGVRDDLLTQPEVPSIISVPSEFRDSSPFQQSNRRGKRSRARGRSPVIRRVMYPTLYYSGDLVHPMFPLLPDIVEVDWQARLISHLRDWGYEVILKPHPGTHTSSAQVLGDRLGATTLTERFENVMDLADVLLFDYPRTTTFGTALASNSPVVLIDWEQEPFTSDAREKLQRRCRFVRAWFDEQNRLQTDWADLRNGIEESVELTDRAFFDSYLVFGGAAGG